jgi:nucleotide-binding universal stress UspA family protein
MSATELPNSPAGTSGGGTIVVGVDTSESSKEALRWAARQAQLTGASLRVVMSWDIPPAAYWVPVPGGLDFEPATREALDRTIRETLGSDPLVPVTAVVAEGRPAPVLLEQALDAELLVVGSRGHGEFAGMLLGSVSEHCVSHATCPVLVFRSKPAGS